MARDNKRTDRATEFYNQFPIHESLKSLEEEETFIHSLMIQFHDSEMKRYKTIFDIAEVPEALRKNPDLLSFEPATSEDIKWAKHQLESITNGKG